MIELGSSDAANIMGCGFKTPVRAFLEKTGLMESKDGPDEIMRAGTALQPAILNLFVPHLPGSPVVWKEEHRLYSLARGWQRATIDATLLRYDRETDQERISAVEIKAVIGQPPPVPRVRDVVQCLHQRMVLLSHFPELEAQYLVYFGALRLVWFEIPCHVPAMDRILRAEEHFLGLVERQEPPPVMAADATLLHHRWPWSKPETVKLGADLQAASVAYAQGSEMVKVGEEMKGRGRAQIESALQEHEGGLFPDGTRVTWRTGKDGVRRFKITYREESE